MWVVFNPETLFVYKTFIAKGPALKLRDKLSNNKSRWPWARTQTKVEWFEPGQLDKWLAWKILIKKE